MILQQQKKTAKIYGDIKENKVGIDTKNLDFIVQILSTNLYSSPIESFIRETTSNAWDSHVEAGIEDPVIIDFSKDIEGNFKLTIQDFGVGLSPERFNNIYRNIGSSTKRDSNAQIGGFGIGRFSALSVSDMVTIISVYNGMEYTYLMHKDGNSIRIDTLNVKKTKDRNGVSVSVPIPEHKISTLLHGILSQLMYFNNVYFSTNISTHDDGYNANVKGVSEEFNDSKIKRFKNFSMSSLKDPSEIYSTNIHKLDIVLGKVRYPINWDTVLSMAKLKKPTSLNYNSIINSSISLNFEIGELMVTPNREQLLYTDDACDKIMERLHDSLKEVYLMAKDEGYFECETLGELFAKIQYGKDTFGMKIADKIIYVPLIHKEFKCRGEIYKMTKDFERMFQDIVYHSINLVLKESDGKSIRKRHNVSISSLLMHLYKFKDPMYLADLNGVKQVTKAYIREEMKDSAFLSPNINVRKFYKKMLKKVSGENRKVVKKILRDLFENFSSLPRFSDADVPEGWRDVWIAERKSKRKNKGDVGSVGFNWNENMNLHMIRKGQSGWGVAYPESYTFKDLKDSKHTYIYSHKDDPRVKDFFNFVKLSSIKNMTFEICEIAPTKIKLIENFDNFVSIDKIYCNELKILEKIGAGFYIDDNVDNLDSLYQSNRIIKKYNRKAADLVYDLFTKRNHLLKNNFFGYQDAYKEFTKKLKDLCKKNNYYDPEIVSKVDENLRLLRNCSLFSLNAYSDDFADITNYDIIAKYVMQNDLFEINEESQKKINNSKFLKTIKPLTNESN